MTSRTSRLRIRVRGAVQGVGFRPFVWTLARDLGLSGWVLNDAEGVLLEVEGREVAAFLLRLEREPPPLARISAIEVEPRDAIGETAFEIRKSVEAGAARTLISPDMATCDACIADIRDPADRRAGYPFVNCTHCGPRYTITAKAPYDRANTSMAAFPLCPDCAAEYADPGDRRFHAQPVACPTCGPRLSHPIGDIAAALADGAIVALKGIGGYHLAVDARNAAAVARLRARKGRDGGKPFAVMVETLASARTLAEIGPAEAALLEDQRRPIVICGARSAARPGRSVFRGPRARKAPGHRRFHKPNSSCRGFPPPPAGHRMQTSRPAEVFSPPASGGSTGEAGEGGAGRASKTIKHLLPDRPAPPPTPYGRHLPRWRGRKNPWAPVRRFRRSRRWRAPASLAPGVTDGLPTLGLMLPYAPLHVLLFDAAPAGFAMVMTSANVSGEPLITDDAEARTGLAGIADLIVSHDRGIVVRCDDTVLQLVRGAPQILRRGRGVTPEPIDLGCELPPTLALGGHLKSAICVIRGREAFLSQHVGDLDSPATFRFFEETIAHLLAILDVRPDRIACDLHPDFQATRHADALGDRLGRPVVRVQHHHAHVAAVCAEHQVSGPILGVALDGFGLGADLRSSWGGERLVVEGAAFARTGSLAPLRQPGGDKAAQEPWRMAAAALHALRRGGEIAARFAHRPGAAVLAAMLDRGVNAPETSSAGRVFDAAAGLLGVAAGGGFDGEAPMRLQGLAETAPPEARAWATAQDPDSLVTRAPSGVLSAFPLLARLLDAPNPAAGAVLFHQALAAGLARWIADGIAERGLAHRVALSGGCWQNKLLLETVGAALEDRGTQPLTPRAAPANDGGLPLGQAWVAAHAEL